MGQNQKIDFPVTSDTTLKRDLILMRYLDLAKFIDLISTKTLYVASAVDFDDQLEGTLPEQRRESYQTDPVAIEYYGSAPVQDSEHQNRVKTNISCWTRGPKDNMALWKIYGASKQSIAIITTFDKLLQSTLLWKKKNLSCVTFKEVVYIDHTGNLPDGLYPLNYDIFGLKHEAYSFENEVRMIITRNSLEEPSPLRLKVNLNDIIKKIIVSPGAGEWFYDLVKSVSKRYQIKAPVEHSKLTALIDKAKFKD